MARFRLVAILLGLATGAARVLAQEGTQDPLTELDPVQITARREVELPSSYQALHHGMKAALEAKAELAPNAVLSLRLQTSTPATNLRLSLVGANTDRPITLREDLSFDLPMDDEALLADNPQLRLAGAGNSPTIGLSIRTPGTHEEALRLGDLRLSCAFLYGMRVGSASGLQRTWLQVLGTRGCRFHATAAPGAPPITLKFKGKSVPLEARDGRVEIPVQRSRYPHDALVWIQAGPLPPSTPASAP